MHSQTAVLGDIHYMYVNQGLLQVQQYVKRKLVYYPHEVLGCQLARNKLLETQAA